MKKKSTNSLISSQTLTGTTQPQTKSVDGLNSVLQMGDIYMISQRSGSLGAHLQTTFQRGHLSPLIDLDILCKKDTENKADKRQDLHHFHKQTHKSLSSSY